MPRKRDPLKRLTDDEQWDIAVLDRDIQDLWRDLGGSICKCGRITTATACEKCKALPK